MSSKDFSSSKKTDAAVVEHVVSVAAQEPSVQSAENDQACSQFSNAELPLTVYCPQSCAAIRQYCGVTLENIVRSFKSSNPAGSNPEPVAGGNSKRGFWSKAPEEVIQSHFGHYLARSVSDKQLKLVGKYVEELARHVQECPESLLPRFYLVFSVKVARSRNFEHWLITDNLDHVPLSILQRYDLKGCPWSRTTNSSDAARGEVLKDGNVEEVAAEGGKKAREFPSVNPLHARKFLDVLSEDLALLERLNRTNYSVYLIVSPPVEQEGRKAAPMRTAGPSKPPHLRLAGPKCTMFVSVVDVLQEWVTTSRVKSVLSFFRGPAKAKEARGAAPKEFAARLLSFITESLSEHKAQAEDINWSHAVRTKASLMFVSPSTEQHTAVEGVTTPAEAAPSAKSSTLTFPFARKKPRDQSIEPKQPKNRIEAKSAPPPPSERWWELTPDSAGSEDAPAASSSSAAAAAAAAASLPRRRLFNHQRTPPPADTGTPREISVGPGPRSSAALASSASELPPSRATSREPWERDNSSPLPSPKNAG